MAPRVGPTVDIASLVAAAVKKIVLSNSSDASADELRSVLSQAMTGAHSACQEIGAKAERQRLERSNAFVRKAARKTAAESELAVRRDVAGMLVKIKADNRVTRLGVGRAGRGGEQSSGVGGVDLGGRCIGLHGITLCSVRVMVRVTEWGPCSRWSKEGGHG